MTVSRTARYLLFAFIVWLPLPLGSNRPIVWFINGMVTCLIVALFLAGELSGKPRPNLNWRAAVLPLATLIACVLWMLVQIWPNVPAVLRHPVWSSLGTDLPGIPNTISANPSATWATLVQTVPAILLAVVAMRLGANRRHGRVLLAFMVGMATAVSVYGLGARYFGLPQIFLTSSDNYEGYLTGPFISRNAAAAYLVIGLVGATAMIIESWARAMRADGRGRERLDGARLLRASSAPFLAFLIIAVGLYNTGSRAGVLSGIAGILVVTIVSKRPGASIGRRNPTGIILAVLFAVLVLSSQSLLGRFQEGLWDDGRLGVFRDTIDMITARPLLGHGAGTFVDSFQAFHERAPTNIIWNRAHNTYLQAAAEFGIPVFLVIALTIVGVFVYMLSRLSRQTETSVVAAAACGAIAAAALHSLVDFTAQFQAVGVTLAILVGAGFGDVSSMVENRRSPRAEPPLTDPPRLTTLRQAVRVTVPRNGQVSTPDTPSASARTPDGRRLYVFGDLHGRLDLLDRLRVAIRRDLDHSRTQNYLVIGLGDYIDRGPQSAEVAEALATDFFGGHSLFLRGNHEQMMLDFLEDPIRYGSSWLRNGGTETLRSYANATARGERLSESDLTIVREELMQCISPAQLALFRAMPTRHQAGDYFFAHAGARPGTPLPHQSARDLLWIREGFSDRDEPFDKIIVHGHTPVDQPYFGKYRINLDTGAHFTGRLTCLVLEETERRLLSV